MLNQLTRRLIDLLRRGAYYMEGLADRLEILFSEHGDEVEASEQIAPLTSTPS